MRIHPIRSVWDYRPAANVGVAILIAILLSACRPNRTPITVTPPPTRIHQQESSDIDTQQPSAHQTTSVGITLIASSSGKPPTATQSALSESQLAATDSESNSNASPTMALAPANPLVSTDTTSPNSTPRITNLRDSAFVISWFTDSETSGRVLYGEDLPLESVALDDHGSDYSGLSHYVTIVGLLPETTYYFDVLAGEDLDDNGGQHYQVTTGPTLGLPQSDVAYGQVFEKNRTTPAEGAIVYVSVVDRDGQGTTGTSAEMSSLVDVYGYWNINLGNARSASLWDYFGYSGMGDDLKVQTFAGSRGAVSAEVSIATHTPFRSLSLEAVQYGLP